MIRPGLFLVCVLGLAACGDSNGPDEPPLSDCATDLAPVSLGVGEYRVIDPEESGACVRLPAAGGSGAEHLYVALATAGQEVAAGVSASYRIRGGLPEAVASEAPLRLPSPTLAAFQRPGTADAFHAMLRARERELAASPALQFDRARLSAGALTTAPPTVGSQRTFKVCSSTSCSSFVDVVATAMRVGPRSAIYLDDTVPANGYTPEDIEAVGALFDDFLYPIDTTAFGRESDLDANGVVVMLLTDQVNKLSGNCNVTQSVILGYFFGGDLVSQANSNNGEIFYGVVPDAASTTCSVTRSFATSRLAPTFIHEFQHMISFNQHTLLRAGPSEDTWLNEGLSHFAEELGGRLIPDEPGDEPRTRFSTFAIGDVLNANTYLSDPEAHFLITPGSSTGTLAERGANWLFVRWLVDQYGADSVGSAFTRQLVATNRRGADNVATVTAQPFSTLVTEWQLANYLDNLPGFAGSERLQYKSWNFRSTYLSLHGQDPVEFPREYPLVPDVTETGDYARAGRLRAGSGRHLLVVQPAGGSAVDLQLADSAGTGSVASAAAARIGVVRIR